jgi:dihydroflavonol-4-reductase
MSHILVTGATGLVGSVLTQHLVAHGHRVRILCRPTSRLGLLGETAHQVEHAQGDVNDPENLRAAMTGITHVYHAAAFVGFAGQQDEAWLFEVNVEGTAHVVNAALAQGIQRLVHTSSMAAFGRPEQTDTVIDEATPWQRSRHNTRYARSKYEAEREVFRGIAEGLDAVIVNPALIFGIGRPGENTRQIIDQVRHRKLPAFPSGGTCVVDVRDVAEGHLRAMEQGQTGERYFLGSENLSWRDILTTLAAAFGVAPPRLTLPPGPALGLACLSEAVAFLTRTRPLLTRETARTSSRTYRYSPQKAREQLGWNPRPFHETAAWLAGAIR